MTHLRRYGIILRAATEWPRNQRRGDTVFAVGRAGGIRDVACLWGRAMVRQRRQRARLDELSARPGEPMGRGTQTRRMDAAGRGSPTFGSVSVDLQRAGKCRSIGSPGKGS